MYLINVTWQPRRVDWNALEQWWLHCTSQWGHYMLLIECVYCVAITCKMTEWGEQQIYIKFCFKLEHSSAEAIRMIQKPSAMGNWWWAASSGQHARWYTSHLWQFFGETSNHPGDSAPLHSDLVPHDFWLFPKLKSPLKGKRLQTLSEILLSVMVQLMVMGRNYLRSQGANVEGNWDNIVLCMMFPVSCIFFNKCLFFSYYMAGYLWTDYLHTHDVLRAKSWE